MIRRFASDLSVFTLGSFLAVVSQGVGSGAAQWWLFAVGVLTALAGAYGAYDTARGEAHRGVDALTAVLGVFAVVASFAWSAGTLLDVTLVVGIAYAALGALGLVIHELRTERVVHALEVSSPAAHREEHLVR
ncbi:hypothetical protein [Patulibacter minatonensis]|uniref:hypothetical protein n=1 Tax=Patulibacter minatonensis TaxID=298163 RepID=UPI000478EB0D|nr:hypothetical protein [Patulibacter minatonensis]